MKVNFSTKFKAMVAGVLLVAIGFLIMGTPKFAHAASLSNVSDTMSELSISATSSHKIAFTTPTGIASSKTVVITFPQSAPNFNFAGKTFSDVTITWGPSTGLENSTTTAATAAASVWGVTFTGTGSSTVTLSSPTASAIPAGSKVIVNLSSANAINPGTAGILYPITITGTFGDTGGTSVYIVNTDQVIIAAIVPQSLQFAISTTTLDFGTFTPGVPRYASTTGNSQTSETLGNTLSVTTNAANGYSLTATGTTLTTGTYNIAAIGNTAAAANTTLEQFGFRLGVQTGPGTVSAPFNVANQYAFVPGALNVLATMAGPGIQTVYNVFYEANVIGTTKPGAYSTAITYAATANF